MPCLLGPVVVMLRVLGLLCLVAPLPRMWRLRQHSTVSPWASLMDGERMAACRSSQDSFLSSCLLPGMAMGTRNLMGFYSIRVWVWVNLSTRGSVHGLMGNKTDPSGLRVWVLVYSTQTCKPIGLLYLAYQSNQPILWPIYNLR